MDYETPTCIVCEREWAGDYPVCMPCATVTHFPNRVNCLHCEMLADVKSKDLVCVAIDEAQSIEYDEWYCAWYRCPKCAKEHIARSFCYCPDCGVKLDWQEHPKPLP